MAERETGPVAAVPRFTVGEWLVEPAWNRIRRGERSVKLEPRVMRLLTTLAAAPGRPLQRQELLDAVWPDVLVNEEALSRAVSQLRRALGDDPKTPQYVQTVHKGGYCLIAPVAEATSEATPSPAPTAERSKPALLWPLLLVVAAAIGVALLVYRTPGGGTEARVLRPLVPLTSDPGREIDPAVSPDGKRVAYLASTEAGYQLFVRALDGGAPVRITADRSAKGHPVWSPDGTRIAYVAAEQGAAAIHAVPAKGGTATKLAGLPSWSYGLDWSPDGRTIAYSDAAPGEAAGIVLLDLASRAARPVARSAASAGDVKPVFSPDGKRLAFVRVGPLERQQIALVKLAEPGRAVMLGAPPQDIRGLDWSPDGEALIFSGRAGRRFGLYRLAADGRTGPQGLASDGGDLFNPSISRDGRVVVEEVEQDRDVWRAEMPSGSAAPLIRSTSDDYDPAHAPGGARIAFVSERSGRPEIWLQPRSGEARRLTSLAGDDVRQLSWSPDGRRLAFLGSRGGAAAIYVAEAAVGAPVRRVASGEGRVPIGWSADGASIYLLVASGGGWAIEEFGLAGGRMRTIPTPVIRIAALARDRASIFAVAKGENKLLRIDPRQGVVRQFRLPQSISRAIGLLASADWLYLVEEGTGDALVHRIDLGSGAVSAAGRIGYYGGGISLAPDGRSIAYTRAHETANDLAWTQL